MILPGWADVESDDEEEHFPGFGDLAEKTNVTNTGTTKQQEPETQVTNPFLGSFFLGF